MSKSVTKSAVVLFLWEIHRMGNRPFMWSEPRRVRTLRLAKRAGLEFALSDWMADAYGIDVLESVTGKGVLCS